VGWFCIVPSRSRSCEGVGFTYLKTTASATAHID
jgi:hypothetical protein